MRITKIKIVIALFLLIKFISELGLLFIDSNDSETELDEVWVR